MLKTLPQNELLGPNSQNPHKVVEYINSYVDNVSCKNISVDISFMNAIDASYVSTMCSTNHYIKYPEKLNLCNSEFLLK